MVLLILLGVIVVGFLANAYRLDRIATAKGLKYVPVKEKGWIRTRTRMVLVEKDAVDHQHIEKLHEEQLKQRQARASYDPWRFLPSNLLRWRKR